MAEKQLALASIGKLNPLKLGKEGYVLRIENALEKTSLELGKNLDPTQRKRVAMVMARDMLRSVIENTESDAKDAEKAAPKKLRSAVKILMAAGGVCLLSLGLGHYAKDAGLENYVEISKVGVVGALVVSIYSIKDTLDGTFCFVAAKLLRKRLPKFVSMVDQLGEDITDLDLTQIKGPGWKN